MNSNRQYIESARTDFNDMQKEATRLDASIDGLIEVIHEQEEKIETLEARISELEDELDEVSQ